MPESIDERRGSTPGPPKPGAKTTKFWTVAGALVAALATALTASDRAVQLAGVAALTVLGTVLGGIYIRCRTRVKAGRRARS